MPKVTLTKAQRQADAIDEWERTLLRTIRCRLAYYEMTNKDLADRLHIKPSTFRMQMKTPKNMRIEVLLRIMDELQFTDAERALLIAS
jgi:hypothetical protein